VGDTIELKNVDLTNAGKNHEYYVAVNPVSNNLLEIRGGLTGDFQDASNSVKLTYSVSGSLTRDFFNVKVNGTSTDLTLSSGSPINLAARGPGSQAWTSTFTGNPALKELDGSGIKVGVISNSFGNYSSDVANGVLPASTTVLMESQNTDDEGRALAQVVHAIAPGASIYFYSDYTGAADGQSVAEAVTALEQNGCNIILDDRQLSSGDTTQSKASVAIQSAISSGETYFTSAGNSGGSPQSWKTSTTAITVGSVNWLNTPYGPFARLESDPFSSTADISAPDGGPTSTHYYRFFGTSAATPAAAAVAALMLEANPTLTNQNVRDILEATALSNANVRSAGLIQADQAVLRALGNQYWHPFYSSQGGQTGLTVASAAVTQANAVSAGATVRIVLRMNEAVQAVSGVPTLTLNDGGTATYDAQLSNLSAGQLVFDYRVGSESTPNLKITKVNLPSGAPYDINGNDADFSGVLNVPTNLSINSPLTAAVSTPQSGEANVGQTVYLTLTTNEAVVVNTSGGAPTLTLNDGGTATYEAGLSNPAAGKLVFDYTIGTNDNAQNLAVAQVNLLPGTTIQDANGNNADFSAALDVGTALQIGPVSAEFIAASQNEANTGQTVQLRRRPRQYIWRIADPDAQR
jgi:Subtilase family